MKQIFLLFLIASSICFGQTKYDEYEKLISEADHYKGIEDFGQAIIKYHEALQILTPNSSTPFFKLAECALKFKNTSLADEWIRKGVSQGGAQMEYLRKYKGFENIQEMEFYKAIISDYNSLRQKYFSTLENIDIYLEIEELIAKDQLVRKTDDYLDLPSEDRNELMRKVDSVNVDKLMKITKEHGWQERAWIILWHQRGTYDQDNYVWNYFKPLIDKEIEEGKISRHFWGFFDGWKKMIKSGNLERPEKKKAKE